MSAAARLLRFVPTALAVLLIVMAVLADPPAPDDPPQVPHFTTVLGHAAVSARYH